VTFLLIFGIFVCKGHDAVLQGDFETPGADQGKNEGRKVAADHQGGAHAAGRPLRHLHVNFKFLEIYFYFRSIFRFTPKDDVKGYNIWGVALAEVEVDILTGEKQVN
jgi:hypothetical protein